MTNWATAAASRTPTDMDLAVWQSEVFEAFQPALTLIPKLRRQQITSGTTARFAKTWKMGSEILEAGAEVLGSDFETGLIEISLDTNPLVASQAIYDIDAMLAQYEFRSPVMNAMGAELAKQAEQRAWSLLVQAAIVANDADDSIPETITDSTLGISAGVLTDNDLDVLTYGAPSSANIALAVETLLEGIDAAQNGMDDKDVPKDRYCAVGNRLFNACRKYGLPSSPVTQSSNTFGGVPNLNPFGAPAITQGVAYNAELDYNGVKIFNMPAGRWGSAAVSTGPTKWRYTTANVEAIVFHADACAWVEKYGVTMETQRFANKLQWLTLAHTMHGGGTLRPYCCVLLKGNGS